MICKTPEKEVEPVEWIAEVVCLSIHASIVDDESEEERARDWSSLSATGIFYLLRSTI